MVLADYTVEQVEKAVRIYLKTNSELPAPADVVNIIERNGKPPFDKAVYVTMSRKRGDERTSADWEYMRDYERFITTGRY